MVEFSLPRGMRDITPDEEEGAERVRAAFLDTCRLFDYKIMEPSSLEMLETLEAKSGSSIKNEIYYFKDKSGRDLGLRFDLTVGMTRYVASRRDLASPIRLGAFAANWRYEEPQLGRYRWFYQWDAEVFGPSNPEADAEVIEFSSVLFKKFGLTPELRIGSRKIIERFIRTTLNIENEETILAAMRAIDKLSKKSFDEIVKEYENIISRGNLQKMADFTKISGKPREAESVFREKGIDASGLMEIFDSLKARGVENVSLDLGVVRGIDYYTDMVFEAFDSDNRELGSLCGGGRYDNLPGVYGRPELGATGVAGGVERAILSSKSPKRVERRIFVAPVGKEPRVIRAAAALAAELRAAGLSAQSEILQKSLRKILEWQAESKTQAVIIIGERELTEGIVKIRWMESGEEESFSRSKLQSALLSRLDH